MWYEINTRTIYICSTLVKTSVFFNIWSLNLKKNLILIFLQMNLYALGKS